MYTYLNISNLLIKFINKIWKASLSQAIVSYHVEITFHKIFWPSIHQINVKIYSSLQCQNNFLGESHDSR